MNEKYSFVEEKDFKKMKKSEKLKIPVFDGNDIEIEKLLLLPISRKNDGYGMGAFFVETRRGWARLHDYNCWCVLTDISSPIPLRYNLVRGDFEYGGVVFFEFGDGRNVLAKAEGYGGSVVLHRRSV